MKKGCSFIFAVLVILLLVFAAITCPTEQDHEKKLAQVANSSLVAALNDEIGTDVSLITSLFSDKLVGEMMRSIVSTDKYIFFSIGKLDLPTKSEVVSVGIFHQVYTINEDVLTDVIKDKIEDGKKKINILNNILK